MFFVLNNISNFTFATRLTNTKNAIFCKIRGLGLLKTYLEGVGRQVQLGPRYEVQLNPMAEPIPHEVRPLVRTHVYHPYHAADRQAETDS